MTKQDYLELLVENIHSTTIATIGADGHPQTRVIDMMLYDEQGVYFLTAKGKAFYAQLMEQGDIALSATKDKISISLRGKIKNIGSDKLDEIFEKNTYMQSIYPGDTRSALEVAVCTDGGNGGGVDALHQQFQDVYKRQIHYKASRNHGGRKITLWKEMELDSVSKGDDRDGLLVGSGEA